METVTFSSQAEKDQLAEVEALVKEVEKACLHKAALEAKLAHATAQLDEQGKRLRRWLVRYDGGLDAQIPDPVCDALVVTQDSGDQDLLLNATATAAR